MRKLILAAIAAGSVAIAMPVMAQGVGVQVGPDGLSIGTRDRDYDRRHRYRDRTGSVDDCRTVTIQERDRFGNRVTRRVERC